MGQGGGKHRAAQPLNLRAQDVSLHARLLERRDLGAQGLDYL